MTACIIRLRCAGEISVRDPRTGLRAESAITVRPRAACHPIPSPLASPPQASCQPAARLRPSPGTNTTIQLRSSPCDPPKSARTRAAGSAAPKPPLRLPPPLVSLQAHNGAVIALDHKADLVVSSGLQPLRGAGQQGLYAFEPVVKACLGPPVPTPCRGLQLSQPPEASCSGQRECSTFNPSVRRRCSTSAPRCGRSTPSPA